MVHIHDDRLADICGGCMRRWSDDRHVEEKSATLATPLSDASMEQLPSVSDEGAFVIGKLGSDELATRAGVSHQ